MYYLPMESTIKGLTTHTNFLGHITTSRQNHLNEFANTEDVSSIYLKLILYYDEVEMVNPLGSKVGLHKLGMFYITFANIHSIYRSKLEAIFLLAICYSSDIGIYGTDKILEPFFEELLQFQSGKTISLGIDDVKTVFINLSSIIGDTLAVHQLMGFKEGVGFSKRKCRHCLTDFEAMQSNFIEDNFLMRTTELHLQQCKNFGNKDFQKDSVEFGITRLSPFFNANILNFCPFGSMPHDFMHVILEGCLPYTIKHLLHAAVYEEKKLTLNKLNDCIKNFDYSYIDSPNRPSLIQSAHIKENGNLRQSATQMLLLARLLPVFLNNNIDPSSVKWKCYVTLLQITCACFGNLFTDENINALELLIKKYLQLFVRAFPNLNIIPKQHYLVHFGSNIKKSGPPIDNWCMRFEAKHAFFKTILRNCNYNNVLKFMVEKYVRSTSIGLLNAKDLFTEKIIIGPFTKDSNHIIVDEEKYYNVTWAKVNGHKYKKKCAVVWSNSVYPQFAVINNVYVTKDILRKVVFLTNVCVTNSFCEKYNAYSISITDDEMLIKQSKIYYKPQSIYFIDDNIVIPCYASFRFVNFF